MSQEKKILIAQIDKALIADHTTEESRTLLLMFRDELNNTSDKTKLQNIALKVVKYLTTGAHIALHLIDRIE
ncbi:hypothetical protein [Mesonia sp. K4-1]|uniref:hypothetical protein n=1 Tax=Mesonia sp. K4-1 TaxID=2602760 RepID=UPI0011C9FF81|nr:hypothetical protein [Mesonia sp. K4-1]TXK78708.1 hypothetical protein FT986_02630 [Mesonia sp. K4-1]